MFSETAMSSLMRRDNVPKPDLGHELNQLPEWSFFVFMANFILFIPVMVLVSVAMIVQPLYLLTLPSANTLSKRSFLFSPPSKMRSLPLTLLSLSSLSPTTT